jgi:hypothetical protein
METPKNVQGRLTEAVMALAKKRLPDEHYNTVYSAVFSALTCARDHDAIVVEDSDEAILDHIDWSWTVDRQRKFLAAFNQRFPFDPNDLGPNRHERRKAKKLNS